jgi:ubiquinone/menaquinone biosynthesis C-methylase UbiE
VDYKDIQAGNTSNHFWFKAKCDLVATLLERVSAGQTGLKILSLGAGTGDDLEILNRHGAVHVVDIDQRALALINEHSCVEKRCQDACALSYEDNFFDIVIACDVFEHIHDDHRALAQVYRVLKQGGVLIFTVPAHQWLFSAHDRALGHYRRYNKKTLKTLLHPFPSRTICYWNSLLFVPAVCKRLSERWSKPKVNSVVLPKLLNSFCYRLLSIDNLLIKRHIMLPAGISLVGFCRKC